jgi:hypothetical protein
MPYQIRKQAGGGYAIQKKLAGGRIQTVGHSGSKAQAQRSINARNAAAHGARLGGRSRGRR